MARAGLRRAAAAAGAMALTLGSPAAAAGRQAGSVAPACADRPAASGARAAVRGLVVDAVGERPLAGARVTLAAPDGEWTCEAVTGRGGAYRFEALAPGEYRLTVRALGYASRELGLRVDGGAPSDVHLGLERLPTTLSAVRVTDAPPVALVPLHLDWDGPGTADLAAAERRRQGRYLASDARELVPGALTEFSALGETDVLRALRAHPGVSTRDDYTVLPWSRGAPPDQTATTLDGLPLFNAVHAVGAVSAPLAATLAGVALLPSVSPAEAAGGAAAAVRLTTRPGAPEAAGAGEVGWSSVAVSARAEGRAARTGRWLVAARRSTVDTPLRGGALPWRAEERIPYAFHDVAARADVGSAGGWRATVSAFRSADALWGEIPGVAVGASGRWGQTLGRLEVSRPLGGGEIRHVVGTSRMASALRSTAAVSVVPLEVVGSDAGGDVLAPRDGGFQAQPIDGSVRHDEVALSWHARADSLGVSSAAAGVQLVSTRAAFAIRGLWPRSARLDDSVRIGTAIATAALWAERRWRCACLRPLAVSAGARVEVGPRPRNAGPVRVAPRVAARWALSPATALAATAFSSYQYTQSLAPSGPGQNLVAATNALWVTAGREAPVLWARGATVGAERWLGPHALASATAYWRAAAGVLVPDPRAGNLIGRPLASQATTDARGVEASVRRLSGPMTGGVALAAGAAHVTAEGLRYAAPTQRPWSVRGDAQARLLREARVGALPLGTWRLGVAYERAAAAPFTRFHEGLVRCELGRVCAWLRAPQLGRASAARGPGAERLDVALRGATTVSGHLVRLSAQVENVGGLATDGAYLGTVGRCPAGGADAECHPQLAPAWSEDVRLPAVRSRLSLALRVGL